MTLAKYGKQTDALKRVINEVFAQFHLLYPAQFNKAYPDHPRINAAKKLWYEHLRNHPPERIMRALRTVVRESKFLPSVAHMLECCENEISAPPPNPALPEKPEKINRKQSLKRLEALRRKLKIDGGPGGI